MIGPQRNMAGACERAASAAAVPTAAMCVPASLDDMPGAWWFDLRSGLAGWDARAGALLGLGEAPGTGDLLARVHPQDRTAFVRHCENMAEGVNTDSAAFRIMLPGGEISRLRSIAAFEPHPGRGGMIAGVLKPAPDQPADAAPPESPQESMTARAHRSIVEASTDCIKLLDLDGRILFFNHHPGLPAGEDLIGRLWVDVIGAEAATKVGRMLPKVIAGDVARFTLNEPLARGITRWWDVVASPVRDAENRVINVVIISRDITYQKRSEERATWLAKHDPLTNLPNRLYLQNHLDDLIARAETTHFALLLLDVDNFKQINDTLGHDAGDALLRAFADRLRRAVRGDDFIARLGGDEFAVVLNGATREEDIESCIAAIQEGLREPLVYGGRLLESKASIGGSLFPEHGRNRTELMKHADIALYVAKASRDSFELFRPSMRDDMQKRVSMLAIAKEALQQDRIEPYYQAKVDLRSGAVSGFEALLRWRDPLLGLQQPDSIVAAFDDLHLAAWISTRMIDRVIAQMRLWLDQGVEFGHVAVNAAAAEFRRGDFAERVLERLHAAGVPTRCFQLEVTETVFLGRGAEYVERALKTLNAAGVQIALDDFGTGYASLSHLKQFPVDVIKIDRSFVQELDRSPDASAIIQAVINLGRSLHISVVAEGIETKAQEQMLAGYGCDYGQGFLYSKAVPADDAARLLG